MNGSRLTIHDKPPRPASPNLSLELSAYQPRALSLELMFNMKLSNCCPQG